ncbi:glycosyltransferase [Mangrovicoccus algicola]|uniref:Glycosyltransferase n=1 Tax=Mangrovicoccus algicola TaxID=2771008 RepID=A0A8J7D094_9RHOB|nr:glycosyltransferase [Mangrovicoccus algicola]MBE3639133.1 glycosyltransferase [Mangrovicoccus algicola]
MAAPISVVIPTHDAVATLPGTLHSVLPGLTTGLIRELVFADDGTQAAIAEIADELGARLVRGPLAAGLAAAAGDWLLCLDADTHLGGDWCRGLARHMSGEAGQAGYFPVRPRRAGIGPVLAAARMNGQARLLGRPSAVQGLFLPRGLRAAAMPGGGLRDLARAPALRGRFRAMEGLAEPG